MAGLRKKRLVLNSYGLGVKVRKATAPGMSCLPPRLSLIAIVSFFFSETKGATAIAEALEDNDVVEHLELRDNDIGRALALQRLYDVPP